jgi:lysophospholipase L1-like esterase
MFLEAKEKSAGLDAAFSRVAEQLGCAYLNAGTIAASHPADGLHLSADSHQALGQAIAAKIRSILS